MTLRTALLPILIWLCAVSIVSAAVTVWDKKSARRGGRRVPERTLLLLAVLGGGVVMYAVMRRIRHKTKHRKFMVGIPLILLAEAAVIAVLLRFGVLVW